RLGETFELASGGGQHGAVAVAHEHLSTEFIFERPYPCAHRGLCDVKPVPRRQAAAGVDALEVSPGSVAFQVAPPFNATLLHSYRIEFHLPTSFMARSLASTDIRNRPCPISPNQSNTLRRHASCTNSRRTFSLRPARPGPTCCDGGQPSASG